MTDRHTSEPDVATAVRNRPGDLVALMRPHQWLKNVFVFAGLIFGHAWNDSETVVRVASAAVGFCLVASSVYLLNDVVDRAADRQHPVNRHRPVAAGRVSIRAALLLATVLLAAGLALETRAGGIALALTGLYAAQNVVYSLVLKHVVIVDVLLITMGFMLRLLVGTIGVGIPPSHWLLLSGCMLTLLFGFAKRRAELEIVPRRATRAVLRRYTPAILDPMIVLAAVGAVVSYGLYTLSPRTIRVHGTSDLVYTTPFVAYAIVRYLYIVYAHGGGADVVRDLLRDRHLLLTTGAWVAVTVLLLS